MQNTGKVDPNSPAVKAFREEMRRGIFIREGTMVAFPMCLPGETAPIVHDESRITALDVGADGAIFGGTSGRQVHLFAAAFHGLTGMVFDFAAPPGATRCAAVCCGASRLVAFVNGPRGGRAFSAPLVSTSQDLIQEWGFERPALADLGECVPGEPVTHAVRDDARGAVVGIAARHLFTLDMDSSRIRVIGEAPAAGRIAISGAAAYGRDGESHLWRFDLKAGVLQRRAVPLPPGTWNHPLSWAKDVTSGTLFTVDGEGRIFRFDEKQGFAGPLGRAPLSPVGPMAVTFDGRLFGFCGEEIANLFRYDPNTREIANLGVAASVIERRRYGYEFSDAVVGRDGEIVFGEDDFGGHLWLYFPRIRGGA
jgi:hypothetical protein